MSDARLRLAFPGETLFPPCISLLENVQNLSVPHTPPHDHRPEAGP